MYVDLLRYDPFRRGDCHFSGVPGGEKACMNPASNSSLRAETTEQWFSLTMFQLTSKVNVMNVVNVAREDIIWMAAYDGFRLRQELVNS